MLSRRKVVIIILNCAACYVVLSINQSINLIKHLFLFDAMEVCCRLMYIGIDTYNCYHIFIVTTIIEQNILHSILK